MQSFYDVLNAPVNAWDEKMCATLKDISVHWLADREERRDESVERRKQMYARTLSGGNEGEFKRCLEIPFDRAARNSGSWHITFLDEARWKMTESSDRFEKNLADDLIGEGLPKEAAMKIVHFVRECIHDAIDIGMTEVFSRLECAEMFLHLNDPCHPEVMSKLIRDRDFYLHLCDLTGIWSTDMQYIEDEPSA